MELLLLNTTIKLQACDQESIRSLKCKHRGRLVKLLLCNHNTDVCLYQALLMVRAAWSDVKADTVKKLKIKKNNFVHRKRRF